MERKLASLQIVKKLEPIENADKIERATILGWQCVVGKGEFKVGDMAIFFEVDSVLPEMPEFEFLRKSCWNERYKGFRIKTVKLRGQVSQGVAFPVSILKNLVGNRIDALMPDVKKIMEIGTKMVDFFTFKEFGGVDLTEIIGVQKFIPEIPAQLQAKVKGNFPSFIPKTDEERVQNVPDVAKRNAGEKCYITEKLDGTSATFYYRKEDTDCGVCSRNYDLKWEEKNIHWQVMKEESVDIRLVNLRRSLAIQGEIVGPGIQKNRYNLEKRQFYAFDVYDIGEHRYFTFNEFFDFCNEHGFRIVPILNSNFILEETQGVDYFVTMADSCSQLNPKIGREGIVIRSKKNKTDTELGRLSFKVLNTKYLLKYED